MSIIDTIQSVIQPVIVDAAVVVVLAVVGWFMRRLPERMRIEIEAKHREALHSAINTGVGMIIDNLQRTSAIGATDTAINEAIGYVKKSVPDALKNLAPSESQLFDMVKSKLNEKIQDVLGKDNLTEALAKAGL